MPLELPSKKTKPIKNPEKLTALLYGPSKIGKSSFCAEIENSLFFATEKGYNSLSVFPVDIVKWEDFLEYGKMFATTKHDFKTGVIDTVDNLYKLCSEYVCVKHKIIHPGDMGYGKGFTLVNNEFRKVLTRLSQLPYGLFLISHSHEKDIDTRTGKIKKIVPTLPESAKEIVVELVDMILYCDFDNYKNEEGQIVSRRVIRTKPSAFYEAGDRTGILPEVMELNYKKFLEVFINSNSNEV